MTTSDPLSGTSTSFITPTTIFSLLFFLLLLTTSLLTSHHLLPHPRPRLTFLLHTWHTFEFLIHTLFEGSFLYHCFFTYTVITQPSTSDYPHPASLSSSATNNQITWLGYKNRSYGPRHSTHPSALLWQEYSNADTRWNTTDPTIVSVELLTVLLAGPLAAYICYLLQTSTHSSSTSAALAHAKSTFLMSILATAELYGGFMTFAPEWLTGSRNLRTERAMWKWVYLAGFNGVWVLVPGWVLWVAWGEVRGSFVKAMEREEGKKEAVEGEGKKMR